MARLPVNVSKVLDVWKEVSAQRAHAAGITLAGNPELVEIAKRQFATGGVMPAVWVRPLADLRELASASDDLLVVFIKAEEEANALAVLQEAGLETRAVLVVDEGLIAPGRRASCLDRSLIRVSFRDTPAGWQKVFAACVRAAGKNAVALGRLYPSLRSTAARQIIYRTAAENAFIGVAFFVPGADMPAMTVNQVKMVLSIASLYGHDLNLERAVEVAGIVGMGFGWRSLSRRLRRSLAGISGIGWAIKGLTGYSVTLGIGAAAVRYYERGAPVSTSRVVALAGSLKR